MGEVYSKYKIGVGGGVGWGGGGGGEEWSGGWGGVGRGRGVLDELVVKNIFLRFMHW